jgi:hypothetical protein
MKELIRALLGLLVGLTGIVYLAIWAEKKTCYSRAEKLQIKAEYGAFTGCIAEKNGTKFSLSQYRYTD